MKRVFLFLAVNILVVASISLLLNILGIGGYLTSAGISYAPLLAFCFVWGMAGAFISLFLSKFMAKWMMGVQLVTLEGPHRDLVLTVHRLARRASLSTMPEVGIYQAEELNAFATGPSRNNSLVAVSTGLLTKMSSDELEGVLGHEVAHIANGDMVTMTLVQGIVNAFVMFLSRVAAFFVSQALSGNDDDKESRPNPLVNMILVFIFDILFSILAAPIVAWFSRYREFRADKGGADVSSKEKMISALEALKRNYPNLVSAEEDSSAQNFKALQISSKGSFMKIFSSHPPLEERIAALKK